MDTIFLWASVTADFVNPTAFFLNMCVRIDKTGSKLICIYTWGYKIKFQYTKFSFLLDFFFNSRFLSYILFLSRDLFRGKYISFYLNAITLPLFFFQVLPPFLLPLTLSFSLPSLDTRTYMHTHTHTQISNLKSPIRRNRNETPIFRFSFFPKRSNRERRRCVFPVESTGRYFMYWSFVAM